MVETGKQYLVRLESFLKQEVQPIVNQLDTDAEALFEVFDAFIHQNFLSIYIPEKYGGLALSHEEMMACQEMVGRWAGSLGFLQVQAATTTWALLQSKDETFRTQLFERIVNQEIVVGNATSHLKRDRKPSLVGEKVVGGYVLNGINPFASGWGAFDYMMLGFNTADQEVFATIPFKQLPKGITVTPVYKTFVMNSLNTVGIKFDNYFLPQNDVVGAWEMFRFIDRYRERRPYAFPLGIAVEAMSTVEQYVTPAMSDIYTHLMDALNRCREKLYAARCTNINALFAEMIAITLKALQFSILVGPSKELMLSSHLQRLYREILIWFMPRTTPEMLKQALSPTSTVLAE